MTVRVRYILLVVMALAPTGIYAFDLADSHAPALGQTVVLSQPTPTTLVNTPGGGIINRSIRFEIGYNRKYDLADLDRVFVAAATRRGPISAAIGLSQFGKSALYSEKALKGMISYQLGQAAIGLTGSAINVQFGSNYGQYWAGTFGAGLAVRSARLLGSVVADNLTRPKLFASALAYPRTARLNIELLTARLLSVTLRTTMTEHEKPRVGLGQRIPLSKVSALYWGVSTRPLEYGAGVDIGRKGMVFTYAAAIHPVLGFSQTISLSIGSGGAGRQSGSPKGDEF
jgi:hypothetical protein